MAVPVPVLTFVRAHLRSEPHGMCVANEAVEVCRWRAHHQERHCRYELSLESGPGQMERRSLVKSSHFPTTSWEVQQHYYFYFPTLDRLLCIFPTLTMEAATDLRLTALACRVHQLAREARGLGTRLRKLVGVHGMPVL